MTKVDDFGIGYVLPWLADQKSSIMSTNSGRKHEYFASPAAWNSDKIVRNLIAVPGRWCPAVDANVYELRFEASGSFVLVSLGVPKR